MRAQKLHSDVEQNNSAKTEEAISVQFYLNPRVVCLQWEHNCLATGATRSLVHMDSCGLAPLCTAAFAWRCSTEPLLMILWTSLFLRRPDIWEMCSSAKMWMRHFTSSLYQVNPRLICRPRHCHDAVPWRKAWPAHMIEWRNAIRDYASVRNKAKRPTCQSTLNAFKGIQLLKAI